MAIIPSTTFKNWKDGDTVNAREYMQELEILRTAINDNGQAVSVLQAASQGTLKKIPSGKSFPVNPEGTEVFFREDEGIMYVLNEKEQWVAFGPLSTITSHTSDKENPHGVTPSQIGAYTRKEADEKYTQKTDLGVCSGYKDSQSFNSGFFIFPASSYIQEMNANLYAQKDTNSITFKKGGMYLVTFSCARSDVLANQSWKIGYAINDNQATLTQQELVMGQYGWGQTGGPNLSKVPLSLTHVVRVSANDYINFNNNSADGPRSYMNIRFSIARLSD